MPSSRPSSSSRTPRSLADDLRARDDDALVALLQARPDLAAPVPADTGALAVRASTRHSTQRAVDALSRAEVAVLEALVVLAGRGGGTTTPRAVAAACGLRPKELAPHLERLRELALVWGTATVLHPVGTLADALGPYPAGLGPSLGELVETAPVVRPRVEALGSELAVPPTEGRDGVADRLADPGALAALLDRAPEGTQALLARVDAGGPLGSVSRARRALDPAVAGPEVTPLDWLLSRGLLVPVGDEHVVLPREVGLGLRGGRVHHEPVALEPPPLRTSDQPASRRDALASGAAAEAVRLVDSLGRVWGARPAAVLRAGGLGVRELTRTATELEVDTGTAALVVELAAAAGLVAEDGEADPHWTATPRYDAWTDGSPGQRWATLAATWLTMPRLPSLAGTRDDRGTRAALSDAISRPQAGALRRLLLQVLAGVPEGQSAGPGEVAARLAWQRPRWPPAHDAGLLEAVLAEAAWLGVAAGGALSGPTAALLGVHGAAVGDARVPAGLGADEDDDAAAARRRQAAAALDAALPQPVREVLLQADLTAVAPGPLERDLELELSLLADVDSRGGATVYRFDGSTIRRGLDAGRTAEDVLAFLARVSATPVPQPLEYLVRDVARRHGRVRVGSAGAYLRSDDESVLAELLGERRTASLGLRRLAPTVLVARADAAEVLGVLRSLGLAPAAESGDGTLVLDRPTEHRTPPRRLPAPSPLLRPPPEHLARGVVRALRQGDETLAAAPPPPADAPVVPPTEPAVSLAALRRAASDATPLWIGVVAPDGTTSRVHAQPLTVEGGRITVRETGGGAVRVLSVHRVTGTAPGTPVAAVPRG